VRKTLVKISARYLTSLTMRRQVVKFNKLGYISIKNLRRVAKELGETIDDPELQEMIERADNDNDGLVSEEEFYNIMTKKTFS
jgi:Ca2+-binding EF-hand superfamily protein